METGVAVQVWDYLACRPGSAGGAEGHDGEGAGGCLFMEPRFMSQIRRRGPGSRAGRTGEAPEEVVALVIPAGAVRPPGGVVVMKQIAQTRCFNSSPFRRSEAKAKARPQEDAAGARRRPAGAEATGS